MPPLVLYHSPTCSYCHRVRAAADRLGIPLELRDRADPRHEADLVAATGRRTVPVLRYTEDGEDRWLPESLDILRFLRDRTGHPSRWPAWLEQLASRSLVLGGLIVFVGLNLTGNTTVLPLVLGAAVAISGQFVLATA